MSVSFYTRSLCSASQALQNAGPSLRDVRAAALGNTTLSNASFKNTATGSADSGSDGGTTAAGSDPAGTPLLPRVVFLGRSLCDYNEMFRLADMPAGACGECRVQGRALKVLDVAAGSASFAAESALAGVEVTAVDPRYNLTADALGKLSAQDQEASFSALARHPHYYRPDGESLVALRAQRELTRRYFLEDYPAGVARGRYRAAELPQLPFEADAFDLALCGNFLFLYAHLFDEAFHRRAIDELLRVAREVRIYPLQGLDSKAPPFLERLLAGLRGRAGLSLELLSVQSPVLLGQSHVLVLRRDG